MLLNKEQLARLEKAFLFEDTEIIEYADYKGSNIFVIGIYDTKEKTSWEYLPSELEEERTNYIMGGI